MNQLLEINWESRYIEFVKNIDFSDKSLKSDFLNLLTITDSLTREFAWNKIKIGITTIKEISNLPNPYFIGFGNPNSEILFVGKENGFNIEMNPDLLIKESINNVVHWNYIFNINSSINHINILEKLGF